MVTQHMFRVVAFGSLLALPYLHGSRRYQFDSSGFAATGAHHDRILMSWGYHFNDVALLAYSWDASVEEARSRLVSLLESEQRGSVESALNAVYLELGAAGAARERMRTPPQLSPDEWPAAREYAWGFSRYYQQSEFGYCDAEDLAAYWQISTRQAQSLLGRASTDGSSKKIRDEILPLARAGGKEHRSEVCTAQAALTETQRGRHGRSALGGDVLLTLHDAYIIATLWSLTSNQRAVVIAAGRSDSVGAEQTAWRLVRAAPGTSWGQVA